MISYDTLEDGTITNVCIDGKPVKKSFQNALAKAQKTSYWRFYEGSVDVSPLEYSIIQWIYKWSLRYERVFFGSNVKTVCETPIQTFDNMRYLILQMNSELYYQYID